MEIVGTHHVALYTTNFAQMRQFYTETLGLQVVGGFARRTIIFLDAGSTTIELVERAETATHGEIGWAHLALEVADIDAAHAELTAKGVSFHIAPKGFPEEAPAVRLAFFKDPDGNDVELVMPLGSRYPTP